VGGAIVESLIVLAAVGVLVAVWLHARKEAREERLTRDEDS
jgi:hypothetical protein